MESHAGALAPAPRVLIVDDLEVNLDLLSKRLSLRRFAVSTASSGAAALRLVKEQQPDLVLLDLNMPGMCGLETLQKIRERHSASELPVIMVTASDSRQSMLETIGAGANDYVTKPIDLELLLARMAVQLNMGQAFRKAVAEHARIQRRMETRARLERLGFGDSEKRVFYMSELMNGLHTGDVQLFYQPQFNIRTGDVAGAEALMRWRNETLGAVSPDHFIPMAEETGDIAALTAWSVERAIRDHQRFAAMGHKIRIAINLSATLANDLAFVDRLAVALEGNTEAISLELTESAIFEEPESAIKNISRFAEMGVRVSIDDYGTGMSSLSYIKKFPVHELKIDKMFVTKLTKTHRDPLLVRSTIELAHALDFEVVAEGVEDRETLALLKIMGCDIAQGYLFGAPMCASDLMNFLRDETRLEPMRAPFDAASFMRNLLLDDRKSGAA